MAQNAASYLGLLCFPLIYLFLDALTYHKNVLVELLEQV